MNNIELCNNKIIIRKRKTQYAAFDILCYLLLAVMILCDFRNIFATIDTPAYFSSYMAARLSSNSLEKTYVLLSILVRNIIGDKAGFRVVLIIYSLVSWILIKRIMKKTEYPIIALLLWFVISFKINIAIQIRSGLATLVMLDSLHDLGVDWKKHYIKILFAVMIHSSAILFVFIYPVYYLIKKQNRLFLLILPLLTIISAWLFSNSIHIFLTRLLSQNTFGGRIAERFLLFNSAQYLRSYVNPFNRFSLAIVIIYYLYLYFVGAKPFSELQIGGLAVMMMSLFCYFFGAKSSPMIAYRYPEMLNQVLAIMTTGIVVYAKNKKLAVILVFFFIIMAEMHYHNIEYIIQCIMR
ncbi:MAG: EpsG family protein [Lachnospiraceae bacterium]|nr:EpsG family protein [Lachnospiraceae bacterium]